MTAGGDLLGPLDAPPVGLHPPYHLRRPRISDPAAAFRARIDALRAPLLGMELGRHDSRVLDWLAGWDTETVGTVASLLHRARAADPLPRTPPATPGCSDLTDRAGMAS